jgi:hypothetical protein
MDPVTMGLLKLGVHLMKNVTVVDNVNATTRFFLSFDSNGDKELDPDEIAAALEVLLFSHMQSSLITFESAFNFSSLPLHADAERCQHA